MCVCVCVCVCVCEREREFYRTCATTKSTTLTMTGESGARKKPKQRRPSSRNAERTKGALRLCKNGFLYLFSEEIACFL